MRKCKFKLRSLQKLCGVVTEDQRRKLVEGVIMTLPTPGGGEHRKEGGPRGATVCSTEGPKRSNVLGDRRVETGVPS